MDDQKKRAMRGAVLKKALDALGPESLSVRLGCPVEIIHAWVSGHPTIPERHFQTLLDILAGIDLSLPKPRKFRRDPQTS